MAVTLCVHAGRYVDTCCLLRYQEADRRWDGSLPLHSFSLRGPHSYQQCQSSVFSATVFGQNSSDAAQNQSTEEILQAAAWQGGVLGMLFGAEWQLQCHGRGRLVANQG